MKVKASKVKPAILLDTRQQQRSIYILCTTASESNNGKVCFDVDIVVGAVENYMN